ncbi:MAG: carboxymuconolactone decarboxylase family protein [Pseudomonadota bacterium]
MQYPDLEALTPELKKIVADKRDANVYKMLMHSPNVAPGFTAMADAVMWAKTWPATWRELAIVRVGHLYQAPYEVYQHEQIGRLMGLSDAQLAACAVGADAAALSGDERAILRLTDALVARHTLDPADRDEGLALLGANGFADFVLTVGFYQLVSNFLNVFEVETEPHDLFPKPDPSRKAGAAA